jgi:cold shock protein
MARGKVKWFNNQKGYGFLIAEGSKDIFVHYSVVQGDGYKTLTAGEDVEFDVVPSDRGEQARNVVKVIKES